MRDTNPGNLVRGLLLVTLAAALASSRTSLGYERGTHGLITRRAYSAFVCQNASKLDALGVLRFVPDAPGFTAVFGETYFDMSSGSVKPRTHWSFEDGIIRHLGADPLSIEGWLMRGVIREDDVTVGIPMNPMDDPYGNIFRVVNHFYDPRFDRGLTTLGGARAPDWATGAANAFTQPNTPQTGRRNHFTVFDLQEAMFRALTLKARNSFGAFDDLAGSGDAAGRQALRQAYWATTFRALGDVLHLNQDMAQPQHTRNDPHSGLALLGLGHTSVFEKYIEARAMNERMFIVGVLWWADTFTITPETTVAPTPLNFAVFPTPCATYFLPPLFTQYSDFWSTTPGALGGYGLADYSNAGFFSAGKDLGHNEYSLPPNDPGAYTVTTETAKDWAGTPLPGNAAPVYLYRHDVPDRVDPDQSASAVPLTSFSVYDELMVDHGANPAYHLIRENYDAQADLLLPRAVAYSAGLLGYVFRGSMEIGPPAEGVYAIVDQSTFSGTNALTGTKGFGRVRLTLKNTTPPPSSSAPESMDGGTLFGVLRFHRNTCYADDLSGEPGAQGVDAFSCRSPVEDIVVSDPISPASVPAGGQELTFDFKNGELPINATDVVLQVVYRGPLGNESDAVVVASKDLSEPTFVTLHNALDYLGVGATLHSRDDVNATPALLDQVVPQSCVDRAQTPPRLRAECFTASPATLTLVFGSSSPTTVRATSLPVRRFSRVALLVEPSADFSAVVTDSLQAGTSSWTAPPLVWQYTFEPPNTLDEHIDKVSAIRGIYGFDAFVEFWDAGFVEGAPPDVLLAPLSALTETAPFAVDITPAPEP